MAPEAELRSVRKRQEIANDDFPRLMSEDKTWQCRVADRCLVRARSVTAKTKIRLVANVFKSGEVLVPKQPT
jgi:hypothetical protein